MSDLQKAKELLSSGSGTNFEGLTVGVQAAPGEKCPRCWKHSTDANGEGLCPRCAAVCAKIAQF